MRSLLRQMIYGLVAIAFIIFTLNNSTPVELSLFPLPFSGSVSLSVIVISAFAAGAATGWWIVRAKIKRLKRVHADKVKALEAKAISTVS